MSNFHSYMWSVPDWRTDEMYEDLDNREQGIYRNLIDECWLRISISSDLTKLAHFVRESDDYFLQVWAKISVKFKPIEDGKRLINPRLEEDRRRFMLTDKFYKKRAKKAADARWNKVNAEKALHATSITSSIDQALLEDAQTQTQTKREESLSSKKNTSLKDVSLFEIGAKTKRLPTLPPDDFPITDDMRAWAATENFPEDQLQRETSAMLDHFRGIGGKKLDWLATWRNWIRRAPSFNRGHNGTHQQGSARSATALGGIKPKPYVPKQR